MASCWHWLLKRDFLYSKKRWLRISHFYFLIIIIRNSYIAPNPTRLTQSTLQFKTRMDIRTNTWNMHTPDDLTSTAKWTQTCTHPGRISATQTCSAAIHGQWTHLLIANQIHWASKPGSWMGPLFTRTEMLFASWYLVLTKISGHIWVNFRFSTSRYCCLFWVWYGDCGSPKKKFVAGAGKKTLRPFHTFVSQCRTWRLPLNGFGQKYTQT